LFLKSEDMSIYAVVHCCSASEHDEDNISYHGMIEKEYAVNENILVSELRCASVDTFQAPSCFVVENKAGLSFKVGSDDKKVNNRLTLNQLTTSNGK